MIWALCLISVAGGLRGVHAGLIKNMSAMGPKAAPQEEVNVLMFGVIQFSESLNYAFENTEVKLAKISQTLKNHEGTLQKLGKQAEQAADTEKETKEVIQLLQAQTAKHQAQTKMAKDWLANMEQEEMELKTKVKKLEMYIDNSAPSSIKELQARAEEHSNILKGLQKVTEFQKENIETHNEQLYKLQNMSETMTQPF